MEKETIIKIILILVFVFFVLPSLLIAFMGTFIAAKFGIILPVDAWLIFLGSLLFLSLIWFFSREFLGKKAEGSES